MVGQVPPGKIVRLEAGWGLRLGPAQNVAERVRSPNAPPKGRNLEELRSPCGRGGEGLDFARTGTSLRVEFGGFVTLKAALVFVTPSRAQWSFFLT